MKKLMISLLFLYLCVSFTAIFASAQRPVLVSINKAGTASGNRESYLPVISANGRFVAFTSFAGDLTATDGYNNADIFVRDLLTGTTTLASVNKTGTGPGDGSSMNPSISADGRFVAFWSDSTDLVSLPRNPSGPANVFVRDLVANRTTLVSINRLGSASGNHNSFDPVISADGRFVAFISVASDLTSDRDTNNDTDVFIRDLQAGVTKLVTVNRKGKATGNRGSGSANGGGVEPAAISADGRFVAFSSHATDLVDSSDTNNQNDIFMRDVVAGTTTLVSVNRDGTGSGNGYSDYPLISGDGRFVVFWGFASDLIADDGIGQENVFVRDLQTRTTRLLSNGHGGGLTPALSGNGRYVAFVSYAPDLVAIADNNRAADVFVCDLQTGATTLVSINSSATSTGNGLSASPSISADGRYVAFSSGASDLVSNLSGPQLGGHVFLRDLQTGTTTLADINDTGNGPGNGYSSSPIISPDGGVMVFVSKASNLVTNDTNGEQDIFAVIGTPLKLPPPKITTVKYKASGKLTVVGENFDTTAILFVDDQQVAIRQRDQTTFVVKRLALPAGSHGVRVENSDGQVSSAQFVVN